MQRYSWNPENKPHNVFQRKRLGAGEGVFQSLQKALGCEIRSGCTLRVGAIQRLEVLGLLPRGQRSTESRPRRAARAGWLAGECRGGHENLHLPQPTRRLGCQRSRSGFCLPEVTRELPSVACMLHRALRRPGSGRNVALSSRPVVQEVEMMLTAPKQHPANELFQHRR